MVKHLTTVGLVLALLLVVSTAPAATVLTEDWESGWNNTVWTSGTLHNGVEIEVDTTRAHSGSYSLNASGSSLDGTWDWVETNPPLNTSGLSRVIISMWYFTDQMSDTEMDDFLEIHISTDGTNWTRVWGFASGHSDDTFYRMFVVLPAWAISPNLYVRFLFDDSASAEEYAIDDIVIGDDDPVIGDILWKVYGEFGGGDIPALTNNAVYPNDPILKIFLDIDGGTTVVETPTNWPRSGGNCNNYGQRLAGYIVPPTTGDYVFWCVSDDQSQISLSTDDDPVNAAVIATCTNWANSRDWADADVHQSNPIALTAGQRYFMEILMKEGGGGDNLSVGWQGPGITGDVERPIPLTRFAPGLLPVQSVARTGLPMTYASATPMTITLDLTAGVTTGPLTLTETFPLGVVLSNPTQTLGTMSVSANVATWTIADVNMTNAQATYDVTVPGSACGLFINIDGQWVAGLDNGEVTGNGVSTPTDDGWGAAPIPWAGAVDIDTPAAAGWTHWLACGDIYQIAGAGADVWGNHDECQFLYLWVVGDFTLATHVQGIQFVQDNTKMGLMARADLSSPSAMVTTEISERDDQGKGQGISIQLRETYAGGTVRVINPRQGNNGDAYLAMTRKMAAPSPRMAFYADSNDPDDHGLVKLVMNSSLPNAPTTEMIDPSTANLAGPLAVGLYVVGHNEPQLGIGQFEEVFISSSTSLLDLDSGATVARDLPTTGYYPGAGVAVPVTLIQSTGTLAAVNVVTSETVPAGWTISNIAVSAGGTATVGNTIVWTCPSGAEETLTYDATPGASVCNDQQFVGVFDPGPVAFLGWPAGSLVAVGGEDLIAQLPQLPADDWANAPITWDGAGDVGAVGAAGNTDWFTCDDRYEILASGADIWGGADEFHFIYYIVPGDFTLEATVSWPSAIPMPFPPPNYWAKAGLMLRDNLSAGSPHTNMIIRWGDGDRRFLAQWRDDQGGNSANADSGVNAPASGGQVRMERSGRDVTMGYDNLSGNSNPTWQQHTAPNIQLAAYVGLAVTSHQDGQVGTARYESVTLSTPLVREDVLGAETVDRDLLTTPYTPNGIIPVTLTATPYAFTNGAAFVCTETLNPVLTIQNIVASQGTASDIGGGQILWQIPASPGISAVQTLTYEAVVPSNACGEIYSFSGVFSNGLEAKPVTGVNQSGPMADNGWQNSLMSWYGSDDIGCVGWPGDTLWFSCDNSYVITGGGRDIWDRNDGMHYLWMRVAGDFQMAATVEWISAPDYWSKAGIWARNSLHQGSEYVGVLVRYGDAGAGGDGNVGSQRRPLFERWTDGGGGGGAHSPISPRRIYMQRVGTVFTLGYDALTSPADVNLAAQVWDAPEIRGACLLGLGVTGHSTAAPATARFTNVATTLSQYTRTIGTVTRTFSGLPAGPPVKYTWGDAFTVTITASAPGPAAPSATLVERLPAGAVVSNVTDAGGLAPYTVTATEITWTLPGGWGPPGGQVSYDVVVPWQPQFPAWNQLGGYMEDSFGYRVNTTGIVFHEGVARFQSGVHPDVNYDGTNDDHIIIYQSNNNMGSNDEIEEGDWGDATHWTGDHKKILIRFDLDPYPADRIPTTAALSLYHWRFRRGDEGGSWFASDHTVYAWPILKSWVEGCGWGADGQGAMGGEVTFNSVAHNQVAWDRPGLMASTDVGATETQTMIYANQFGWYSWMWFDDPSGSGIAIAPIQDRVDGTLANYGWKLSQDPNRDVDDTSNAYAGGPYDFRSSEYLDDHTVRPMMEIWDEEATPVEVSTFMLY